jgi:hypothetical protein
MPVVWRPPHPGTQYVVKTIKPTLFACLALLMVAPPAFADTGGSISSAPAAHTQFARFGGGGFRSRGFGSRGFGSRGFRPRPGRGIFRSILRALAIGYLLHLLFTTPGGLLVLVLMVLAVVMLMSRFRRRRSLRY